MTLRIAMLCHYAEWCYAECGILFIIMLNVIMRCAVMLNVIMLSVVAPFIEIDCKLLLLVECIQSKVLVLQFISQYTSSMIQST
jgi:hypothetical protein